MNRRTMMGTLGISTAAVALGAAQNPGQAGAAGQDRETGYDEDLRVMADCARSCNEVAAHCLERICKKEGDAEAHAKVHQMAMDCQAFCVMAATMMARQSPLAKYAHEANAEACRQCAELCEKHGQAEPSVKQCAALCRRCEQICREHARHAHGEHDHHDKH